MQRSSVHSPSQGFTLVELIVVTVMVGVMAALVVPNIIGISNRYRVNQGFEDLRQAFREAQREAMKQSRSCTITVNTSANPVTITANLDSPDPANRPPCIVNRTLPQGVAVATNATGDPPRATFSYRGNATFGGSSAFTAVVFWRDTVDLQKKCVAISLGIGMIRSGDFTGNPTAPNDTACVPVPYLR